MTKFSTKNNLSYFIGNVPSVQRVSLINTLHSISSLLCLHDPTQINCVEASEITANEVYTFGWELCTEKLLDVSEAKSVEKPEPPMNLRGVSSLL